MLNKLHTYRYKIIFLALIALGINCIAIGWVAYDKVYQQLKTTRTAVINQVLQNYTDQLDRFFQEYENGLNQMVLSDAIRNVTAEPDKYQEAVVMELRNFQESHLKIRVISYGTVTGKYYFDPSRNRVPPGYDPRVRPWYQLAVNGDTDRIRYTGVYGDVNTGKPNITMVKSVRDRSGNIAGVLGIILDLQTMGIDNRQNKIGQHGYTFITWQDQYLIDNDQKKMNRPIEVPEIRAAAISQKTGQFTLRQNGETLVYNYRYYPRTGWTLWSVGYESELLAPVHQLIQAVLLRSAVVLILLLAGITYLSKKMVRDMETLKDAADRIGGGDFSRRIEVQSQDEIGELAHRFNWMMEQIQEKNEDLIEKSMEIGRQYEEINALYEETLAMNDTLGEMSDQLRSSYRLTIVALSSAIEANDLYTRGHCERVTDYALKIGQAMGLGGERLLILEYAGLLHDVGKLGVPTEILNKTARLTEEELDIIRSHPQVGYSILEKVPFLKPCADVILQHHERFDGCGYPAQLQGEGILLEARILTLADAFDAMTSARPYRQRPFAVDEALVELEANRGTQFDPSVVDAFVSLIQSENGPL